MKLLSVIAIMLAVFVSGCSWVKVTASGEKVAISDRAPTRDCSKLQTLHVSVRDHLVGSLSRSDKKVARELRNLARNEAAADGGNFIVPVSQVKDGRQSFDVYRCL
ncbi:MAG TPA: DUF4156 domain-containing protein [Cellvibrionaceae bacterium]